MPDYTKLCEDLKSMLPNKVDYADLVCAEGWAHGSYFVYEDPESYFIERAADAIEQLQVELSAMRGAANSYKAENERLKKYENQCHDCPMVCVKDEYIKISADNERLKEANKALESDIYNAEMNLEHMTDENSELKKQISEVTAERDAAIKSIQQPNIVFCRECRFFEDHRCAMYDYDTCEYSEPNDFCSYGERKDGEQQ